MPAQRPTSPAYPLPDSRALTAAADEALDIAQKAADRLGRVMAVVTAAAVRDILTGHDHDAPFDAGHAELVEGADGSLFATGRYWTLAGEERTFTDDLGEFDAGMAVFGMNEWSPYLDDSNRDVWQPLCTELPDNDGRPAYRLDLTAAAALSLD
jgi:hypothetical protein